MKTRPYPRASAYGWMTVKRHTEIKERSGVFLHVFLDGEDVTKDCAGANDELGIAITFLRNADGKRYQNENGEVAQLERHGDVWFEPGEPL